MTKLIMFIPDFNRKTTQNKKVGIMRKVVILTLVTLFTCVEYSQAQTTEKEMTRQEKKRLRKLWTKCYFRKPKRQ